MVRTLVLLIGAAELLWAQLDAREIVRRSIIANDADWKALPDYSHRETDIGGKMDSGGEAKSSKTYHVLMLDGSPYQELIAVNGAPLPARQSRREEARLQKEILHRRRESPEDRARRIGKYNRERQDDRFLMNEMTNAFDFKLVAGDRLDGHPVYVLQATPRPDYRPPNQKAKVLTGMRGNLWVDREHYHWVKVEAEVIQSVNFGYFIAKVGPGTSFDFEQEPVGSDVWLPSRFAETVKAKILGIKSYRVREEEIYSDYRRVSDRANLEMHGSSAGSLADGPRLDGEHAMLRKMPQRFLPANQVRPLPSPSKDLLALFEPIVGRR